jgi:hypothetical protein
MDGKVTGLIQLQFEIEAFFVAILNFFPPSLHFGCATMSFEGASPNLTEILSAKITSPMIVDVMEHHFIVGCISLKTKRQMIGSGRCFVHRHPVIPVPFIVGFLTPTYSLCVALLVVLFRPLALLDLFF